jgi:hypothetical protein
VTGNVVGGEGWDKVVRRKEAWKEVRHNEGSSD